MENMNHVSNSSNTDSYAGEVSESSSENLIDPIIQKVLPFARPLLCRKGEQVLLKGSESQNFFYVQKGAIEVSYNVEETNILVALIGTGNFFGEIGFFDGVSRVRNIRATEDTEIQAFDHSIMQTLQQEDPGLYGDFLRFLVESICVKFRRVLEEREPLTAYAASLSTGGRSFQESKPLPKRFFKTTEWGSVNKTVEEIKAYFYDLSYELQQDSSPHISNSLRRKCYNLLDAFNENLENFKNVVQTSEDESMVWGYVFKEIFPYFMRSRFAERCYYKPKGYAGDFLMMEMIYRNQPDGDGKLGTLVDGWCLNTAGAKAVRGRRKLLCRQLETLTRERLNQDGPIRIMNLACGPNRELFDFLRECNYTEKIEVMCVDIDSEALQYTDHYVNDHSHQATIRLMNENLVKWSLGRVRHDFGLQDIIYSSGLTDYLEPKLFLALVCRCYEHLKPGGVLLIGNFGPKNPNRILMDHVLHWKLIHRNERDLSDLFVHTPFKENVNIVSEEQGVNLFAVATRMDG